MRIYLKLLFVILLAFTSVVHSQHNDRHLSEHTLEDSEKLPDWLNAELLFAYDLMRNIKGGKKIGSSQLGDINLVANINLDKLDLIPGGSILFYYLGNFGGSFSKNFVGDYQIVDNIETFSTTKLYEFWYQQNLLQDKISLAFGIHDYNRDFDELKLGLHLIHSSFGLGPDISQVPPSNFPTTTLGARLKVKPTEDTYILAGAYDGTPSNPNQPGTRISLGRGDGIFSAFESGYIIEETEIYKKFSLGAWYNSRAFHDFENKEKEGNAGAYILSEGRVYSESLDKEQGLGLFSSIGTALQDRNQTDFYFGAGLTYVGLIEERDEDIISFGIANARNSTGYKRFHNAERFETAFEIIYKFKVNKAFTVSPDLQYISNPGMNKDLKDSTVIGVRFELGI